MSSRRFALAIMVAGLLPLCRSFAAEKNAQPSYSSKLRALCSSRGIALIILPRNRSESSPFDLKEENYRNAFREYLWMVLNRSAGALSYWLKMGIAEIYSDLWSSGYSGGASFYHSGTGRDAGLDLSALLAAKGSGRPGVTLGGGSISQHANYARDAAWLVRLLMFGADYAPKFSALVEELASGKEPAGVFQNLYERSVGQVQADLTVYVPYGEGKSKEAYHRAGL